MKFFIDTADLDEIKKAESWGVLAGVTTNPSLYAKTGGKLADFEDHMVKICKLCEGLPVSAESQAKTTEGMIADGERLAALAPNIVVKLPICEESLPATHALAKEGIREKQPELIFLTGGVSKMAVIKEWCRKAFPDAIVITSNEPEFSVAKGLSMCGKIDDELKEFREEVSRLVESTLVEQTVASRINELYEDAVETMVKPILENVALPICEDWRNGSIEKLSDIDPIMEEKIDKYLHSDEARSLLMKPVAKWLKNVSYELEEYTMPICVRHNIPYSSLSLNSFLSMSDIQIDVEAKNLFAVNEITWLIDATISIVVGLLCGGGGVALIANGLPGIIAGAVVSLLILALGKDKMQEMLLNSNIPNPVRKVIPKSYLKARMDVITDQVKESLYEKLEQERNEDISDRLVQEISGQIESCLSKMAEVVEIPLG